jgi:aspartate/methionine/tyrosine aminotransferase
MKIASRMGRIGTESAFEVGVRARALAAEGRDIIYLQIGEPDFDTPRHVVAAVGDALEAGQTHYGPSLGVTELRQAIADYLAKWRGVEVPWQRVVVTPGGKPPMFYTIMALIEPGDEVIYPNPGFPIYESMINFVGGKAVPLQLREEREFRFDPDELRALVTDRTRLIVLNSPQNPTGGVLTRSDLEAVAAVAIERDIPVLTDEIYARILYEGEHISLATLPGMLDRTVLLDGFSKTWAMTGWRLGYAVFPEEMIPHVDRLIINSVSCTATFSQIAAIQALIGPQDDVDNMLAEFRIRRDAIVAGLNEIPGISCLSPHGAFYVFPNITGLGKSSREIADLLLTEAGVATLSGTAFGEYGEGYLRLSYANSLDNLNRAVERIAEFARELV